MRPVNTHAVLVDPETMTLAWMNEAAARGFTPDRGLEIGMPLEQAIPFAQARAVPEALREVARTGVPRHLHAALVSVARGTISAQASIYRLPDGMVLMLTEHTFHKGAEGSHNGGYFTE